MAHDLGSIALAALVRTISLAAVSQDAGLAADEIGWQGLFKKAA
jgi:hypothetical protein